MSYEFKFTSYEFKSTWSRIIEDSSKQPFKTAKQNSFPKIISPKLLRQLGNS